MPVCDICWSSKDDVICSLSQPQSWQPLRAFGICRGDMPPVTDFLRAKHVMFCRPYFCNQNPTNTPNAAYASCQCGGVDMAPSSLKSYCNFECPTSWPWCSTLN